MNYSEYIKSQVKHHRCVICAKTFGAKYDEILNAFPVYHPFTGDKFQPDCENLFFHELIRMYQYIREQGESVAFRKILEDFPWNGKIIMKKEMLEWCMRQGYFKLNSLKRLLVPPPIQDSCKEMFAKLDMDDPQAIKNAIDLLKAALRCFRSDLARPAEEDLPIRSLETDRGETTLYDRIDTSQVELRSQRDGMATASSSGANEIEKRVHAPSVSMERRRIDHEKKH